MLCRAWQGAGAGVRHGKTLLSPRLCGVLVVSVSKRISRSKWPASTLSPSFRNHSYRHFHTSTAVNAPNDDPSNASSVSSSSPSASPSFLRTSYFPFQHPRHRVQSNIFPSPLCRAAFGPGASPALGVSEAALNAQRYVSLGGNIVLLDSSSGCVTLHMLKQLMMEGKVEHDVALVAQVSFKDLKQFLHGEKQRWQEQREREREREKDAKSMKPGLTMEPVDDTTNTQQQKQVEVERNTTAEDDGEQFVSEFLPPDSTVLPQTPREFLPLLPKLLPAYLDAFLSELELDMVDCCLIQPPSINLHRTSGVKDESFEWMGGVDPDLVRTEEGYLDFLRQTFVVMEEMVRQGKIRSYGVNSSRFAIRPPPPPPPSATSTSSSATPNGNNAVTVPHGSEFYVPLQRVIETAQEAAVAVHQRHGGEDATTPSNVHHHLSTIKFPFSLFSACHLLYPDVAASLPPTPPSSPSTSSSTLPSHITSSLSSSHPSTLTSTSSSSFFSLAHSSGLTCLASSPFEDVEPVYHEWIRFKQCQGSTSAKSHQHQQHHQQQDAKKLLDNYRDAMSKITTMEHIYKLLIAEGKVKESDLPPLIPHFSWGSLIHFRQNDLYNVVTFESVFHRRILPSLSSSVHRLQALEKEDKRLADWVVRYEKVAKEACQMFLQAVQHTTNILNDKINQKLVAACPTLAHFPTLEEKCALILLSTPIDSLLTDDPSPFDTLAQTLVKLYDATPDKTIFGTFMPPSSTDQSITSSASASSSSSSSSSDSSSPIPTITSVLQPFLLDSKQLHTVLSTLYTQCHTMLTARVMMDQLRQKKPNTLY